MAPLTLNVGDQDVTFTDPSKARAAGTRWTRMARELDTPNAPPEATQKAHELRARSKAAHDWARREEASLPAKPDTSPKSAPPAEAAAPAGADRRRAAAALTQAGITRTRRASTKARARTGKAVRSYERAGGVHVSNIGSFIVFLIGSVIALVLLEDAITGKGPAAFSKAVSYATTVAHRVIAPIPLVAAYAAVEAATGSGSAASSSSSSSNVGTGAPAGVAAPPHTTGG